MNLYLMLVCVVMIQNFNDFSEICPCPMNSGIIVTSETYNKDSIRLLHSCTFASILILSTIIVRQAVNIRVKINSLSEIEHRLYKLYLNDSWIHVTYRVMREYSGKWMYSKSG